MKRLVTIDIFRGVAIIGVIAAHSILFNFDYSHGFTSMYSSPTTIVLLYFFTWAGIFAIISGIGNALSIYGRIRQGIWTPKKALFNSTFGGTMYLLVNYLYMWIFVPGYPPTGRTGFLFPPGKSGGILFWFIRNGELFIPSPEQTLYATALMMIGWGIIVSGICVYFLTKKGQERVSTRNYLILGTIATLFVVCYPLVQAGLRALITPLTPLSWENFGNYMLAFFASWFVAPMDPIFPYVGFCLYGVIFSLMMADKVDKRKIFTYGYVVGAIYSVVGFTYIAINGYRVPAYDTPPLFQLAAILGPMMVLMTVCLQFIEFSTNKRKEWWLKHTVGIRTFGLVSMSLFVLEGPFAALVRQALNLILPDFTLNLILVLCVLMPIVTILWWILVRLWAKVQFKGSIEWVITLINAKITGKKTDRLNTDYILKGYSAYIEASKEAPAETSRDVAPSIQPETLNKETREN